MTIGRLYNVILDGDKTADDLLKMLTPSKLEKIVTEYNS